MATAGSTALEAWGGGVAWRNGRGHERGGTGVVRELRGEEGQEEGRERGKGNKKRTEEEKSEEGRERKRRKSGKLRNGK